MSTMMNNSFVMVMVMKVYNHAAKCCTLPSSKNHKDSHPIESSLQAPS